MKKPKALRDQLTQLERAGFPATSATPAKGSHWKVTFLGIETPVFLAASRSDHHAPHNTLALLRRLKGKAGNDNSGA